MDVFITNLDEERPGISKQIPGHGQAVAQICEVRMDPISPGIPESLFLLGFACDVCEFPIIDGAAGCRPLEIRIELDPVGRIDIDALNLTSKPFALSQ